MLKGSSKTNMASRKSFGNGVNTPPVKKHTVTAADFHRQQEQALKVLLEDPKLGDKLFKLKDFVSQYINDYSELFKGVKPNTQKRLELFQKASEQFIFVYQAKLMDLRKNAKSSLSDLEKLLGEFVRFFPEGEKSLIHYQDKEAYRLFQNQLLMALNAKIQLETDGSYTIDKGLCIESLLLQNLAKLPISLTAKADDQKELVHKNQHSYKTFIQELIQRTTGYIERSSTRSNLTSMTMPLSALSYFDVMSFSQPGKRVIDKATNPIIDPFVTACVTKLKRNKENNSHEGIIRAIHAIILLSREQDNFKTYLSDREVSDLLAPVANMNLDLNNEEHKKLATQLYQIRNIYSAVFPDTLSNAIKPFISQMQQNSHGSRFEIVIGNELNEAATVLRARYPGLIDAKYFNNQNPICADLGLESDITYENGDVRACIQVDGNKFHQYPGTNTNTQRTKLRDFSFRNQQWKVVNFSDSVHGQEHAIAQLRTAVVIPTFEMLTQQNLLAIKDANSTLDKIKQDLAQIDINAAQADLEQEKQQVRLLGTVPTNIAQKMTDIESLLTQISKATLEAGLKLPTLAKQHEQFDPKAVEQFAKISKEINELEANRDKCEQKNQQYQNDLAIAKLTLERLEKSLEEAQSEFSVLTEEFKQAEQQETANNQKMLAYEQALKAKADGQPVVSELASYNRAQLVELKGELERSLGRAQLAYINKQSEKKKSNSKIAEITSLIEHSNKKIVDLRGEIDSNSQSKAALDQQYQRYEEALRCPIVGTKLLQDFAALSASVATLKSQRESFTTQVAELKQMVKAIALTTSKFNTQAPVFMPKNLSAPTVTQQPEPLAEFETEETETEIDDFESVAAQPPYYPSAPSYPPMGYYLPQASYYPPPQGYLPPQGRYYPQLGAYYPQQGYYPPQQGYYPPHQGYYSPAPQVSGRSFTPMFSQATRVVTRGQENQVNIDNMKMLQRPTQ